MHYPLFNIPSPEQNIIDQTTIQCNSFKKKLREYEHGRLFSSIKKNFQKPTENNIKHTTTKKKELYFVSICSFYFPRTENILKYVCVVLYYYYCE